MADHVGGVAVVEPFTVTGIVTLYHVCLSLCHADGHQEPCTLCFYDAANPPPDLPAAQKLVGEPIWCFQKDNPRHGWLDCQPSIRQRVSTDPNAPDRFHNTFNWQVQYVWLKYFACDARYNVWKILNQYGVQEDGTPMPPVTPEVWESLRRDGYIC